jgi:hypothetical protein
MILSVVLWVRTPGGLQGAEHGGSMFLRNTDAITAWCHGPE